MVKTTDTTTAAPTFEKSTAGDDRIPAHKDFRLKYFAGFKNTEDTQ